VPPKLLDHIEDREVFSKSITKKYLPNIGHRLIDGIWTYELPDELSQFSETVTKIAAHEHSAFPAAVHVAVGIQVDQKYVKAGNAHRGGSYIHRDGFSVGWEHFYVVSDAFPTEFFSFDSPTRSRGFEESDIASADLTAAEPYQIAAANNTSVHRSPILTSPTVRTFLHVRYLHDMSVSAHT
jgi:hypothetical protein